MIGHIYILYDRDIPVYVGATFFPVARKKQHESGNECLDVHKYFKIKRRLPIFTIISSFENITKKELHRIEGYQIRLMVLSGIDLLNFDRKI